MFRVTSSWAWPWMFGGRERGKRPMPGCSGCVTSWRKVLLALVARLIQPGEVAAIALLSRGRTLWQIFSLRLNAGSLKIRTCKAYRLGCSRFALPRAGQLLQANRAVREPLPRQRTLSGNFRGLFRFEELFAGKYPCYLAA